MNGPDTMWSNWDKKDGVIAFDIDDVLIDNHSCTEGCDYTYYPRDYDKLKRMKCPINNRVKELINELKDRGFHIILWTSRIEEEREVTEKYLNDRGVLFDELIMDKPRALLYVDDRAFRFDGDVDALKEKIEEVVRNDTEHKA